VFVIALHICSAKNRLPHIFFSKSGTGEAADYNTHRKRVKTIFGVRNMWAILPDPTGLEIFAKKMPRKSNAGKILKTQR
jgi:hypothetical protein